MSYLKTIETNANEWVMAKKRKYSGLTRDDLSVLQLGYMEGELEVLIRQLQEELYTKKESG